MAERADATRDAHFLGPVPDLYQRLLVPMIFQGAADSLARSVAGLAPATILETAAGTGALTRAMVRHCPGSVITATDLHQPMLDAAAAIGADGGSVTWQQSDALDLPFGDRTFDVVACQFGVMFFPDRVRAFREAARVLKPGGSFVFNTWDRIERNEVVHVIQSALVAAAPHDPLVFMSRTPHGYFSPAQILGDLEAAGMPGATIHAVDATGRTTASEAAAAFCGGTPLRAAIEAHDSLSLDEARAIAEAALVAHFGAGPIDGPIRSFEVVARPPT
ncbi:class I SAM-dependent methyltransferase [Aeromicrobium yanjiei]|uniref:Methyltransferase domain-containing protein n=1 Tax=Aeromicrobium yanjiei TaxID=2662028 RepID=A0A5Q2MLI3_9ACTN|nr:methyltransferase domain-containing protein [Aeromicrobium yanjiei]QGG41235.1 methyltransferase domain-containing protein [Aeromicrobium yanjiei]